MTLKTRVEELEARDSDIRLPSLAQSLLAACGRRLGPASEAPNLIIAAARMRVEQWRQEQVTR